MQPGLLLYEHSETRSDQYLGPCRQSAQNEPSEAPFWQYLAPGRQSVQSKPSEVNSGHS